jgi:hypothetical protein
MWRILMTLAALRNGTGDCETAASYALEARDLARSWRNELGVARANKLLRRFAACSRPRRNGGH